MTHTQTITSANTANIDTVAEWSKALRLGRSPKGRRFEPCRYQYIFVYLLFLIINSISQTFLHCQSRLEKGSTYLHLLNTGKLGLSVGVDNYHMPEKPQAFNLELEQMHSNLTQCLSENEYPAMLLRKKSEEAWMEFPEGFFDIVFVDALHDFLSVSSLKKLSKRKHNKHFA